MSEPYAKLAAKLSELFELEKADLDFGIHRIHKARQRHIRVFLGLEEPSKEDPDAPTLKKIVRREMGELNTVELERQLEETAAKIKTDYGKLAFTDQGGLENDSAKTSAHGQTWLVLHEKLHSSEEETNAQLEAEIYSHLTEFFSRYYDEADFLSKRRIKAGEAPYAVPYSGEEVMLHWANKDQYYVKSSKDLKDYTFTLPERFGIKRVQFKCELQDPVLNNNNAKREFHLAEDEEGKPLIRAEADNLVIGFHFKIVDKTRTKPETKDWIAGILELLPPEWAEALGFNPEGAANDLLTRHLNNYTRKNEADFFIHKQLGTFLRGELDFYIKNEVMHLDDIDEKSADYLTTRVRLVKALRNIARPVITFLAQMENFQKKIWLKKKYVTETQYCFTLDRIFALEDGEELMTELLPHLETQQRRPDGELRSQKEEWIQLCAIDELEDWPEDGKLTVDFLKAHDKLMLDTVFLPAELKWRLLGGMEDLDASLDGLLIHSENFQALNLLQERYREQVKCVYIDPPYNTGGDDFIYKDSYQHSSWNTMMIDRLTQSKNTICENGSIFTQIDEYEEHRLRMLLDAVFSESNRINRISWVRTFNSGSSKGLSKKLPANLDTIYWYGKSEIFDHHKELRPYSEGALKRYDKEDEKGRFKWNPMKTYSKEKLDRLIKLGEAKWTKESKYPVYKKYLDENSGAPLDNNWSDIAGIGTFASERTGFITQKPAKLIERCIKLTGSDLTLDYFAGSGTTSHAVINLNREDEGSRKYILVEMGDHFDTVLKPRLQKVAYSADWKDGKPTAPETGVSHAFKYLRLESYEDALNNLDLGEDRTPDLLRLGAAVREEYLFSYLLDVETRGHLMSLDRFRDPWGSRLKIHDPHTGKSEPRAVDLVETFNYLIGLTVQRIQVREGFLTVEGESPSGDPVLIVWRKLEGDSEWPVTDNEALRAFFKKTLKVSPAKTRFHAVYVNGDHTLEDPRGKVQCIEEVFYERMFENTGSPED